MTKTGATFAGIIAGICLGFSGAYLAPSRLGCAGPSSYKAPQLRDSPLAANRDLVTIEVMVDAKGRVQDYRVVAPDRSSEALTSEAKNMLIFSTFHPAGFRGEPVAGTAILLFPRGVARAR